LKSRLDLHRFEHPDVPGGLSAPGKYRLSARDAIHLAVMEQRGIQQILSFDQGFDRYPNIRRITSV
jgi:uncharacterized protein